MKLSVCVDALFAGQDFLPHLPAIKAAGVDAIEFWCWWDKDNLVEIKAQCDALGIEIIAVCMKFISLCDASLRAAFLCALEETLAVCKRLGVTKLITQVGDDTLAPREVQIEAICTTLREAVPLLSAAGVTIVLEPLNMTVDHPGYFLSRAEDAFFIIKKVDSPFVKVVFDIYHQQITEGNLTSAIRENISSIAHFHGAGVPGRHELDTGEVSYAGVCREIDALFYEGYLGLEYFPLDDPLVGIQNAIKSLS